MKKLLFILVLLGSVSVVMSQPKNSDKKLWKECQKIAKQLEKEGWRPDALDKLDVLIYNHKIKLKDPDVHYTEMVSTIEGQKNLKTTNRARQWAIMNAKAEYAKQARMQLEGNLGGGAEEFCQKYEGVVSTKIYNELRPSVCMFRENDDMTLDYKIFFLVDDDAALKARLNAIEQIKLEAQIVGINMDDVNKYIKENVTIIK